jgi:hypothetical protein
MTGNQTPAQAGQTGRSQARLLANRSLFVIALLSVILGVALGHTLITWLNATLL